MVCGQRFQSASQFGVFAAAIALPAVSVR